MSDKKRVDVALVERGLAQSREKAQALVMSGVVYIGENKVDKASTQVTPEDELIVRQTGTGYVSRGALKQLEDRNKRELNARERSGIMEVLACARLLLRDVLIELEGAPGGIVNADVRSIVERIAATAHPAAIVQALDAVSSAERAIARNVTPQLALEVMLFDIRKALSCPS